MSHVAPGNFVLYRDLTSNQPAWPAVVYLDEYAPKNVRKSRPSGYLTLVVLMGEPYRFRWATTSQLSPFVPASDADAFLFSENLRQAFLAVEFWQEVGAELDMIREEVERQSGEMELEVDSDGVEELDSELEEALRISREETYCSITSRGLPTPSSTPPKTTERRVGQEDMVMFDNNDEDDNDLYSYPLPGVGPCSPPRKSRTTPIRNGFQDMQLTTSNDEERLDERTKKSSSKSNRSKTSFEAKRKGPPQLLGASGIDQTLGRGSLGQHSSVPTSDMIDGDLSESKDFVKVLVGRDHVVRNLPKAAVWDRPYFNDPRSGTNRFVFTDDNTWELRHPGLASMDLDDFQFIAEFLTDGDFGIRAAEGDDQNQEAIAQCVSAWEAGEKMGMNDLLDHIADKVNYLRWNLEDVLTLAIIVYRPPGLVMPANESLRGWISGYMAHHFWEYIKDENIGNYFRKRMRGMPQLERDVFIKRAGLLTSGAERDEDEESDEGELDDTDL